MTLIKFKNGNRLGNLPILDRGFGFPSFFSDTLDRFWTEENATWVPAVNITERKDDFKIDIAAPGMEKKDFRVEVENGVLEVSAEHKEESREENEKISRREFQYGAFKRSFNLPEYVNQDQIEATYKDGILTLLIMKQEEAKEKAKKLISIQ
ncbi:MAG TPA: Hsp20/alpha crystallin family protein [Bacteroidia bacterium]|nr:Hsp20/alpha crystallin family protein [Bacteroidia bacterium]